MNERILDSVKPLEVWALTDDKPGHNAQVVGVCDALGMQYSKKKVVYNEKSAWPNFLKFNGLSTIDKKSSDNISPPWPDIIVSCGRRAAPVAVSIKKLAKKSGKNCYATHMMWPGLIYNKFDLVAIPEHDKIPAIFSNSRKILRTLGAPNLITKDFLLQEYKIWSRTLGELPTPKISILIGGDSKKTSFTMKHAKELLDLLTDIIAGLKASVLVTTSRRTDKNVSKFLKEELTRRIGRHLYFHEFGASRANPFFAFLQISDLIIATGDSISMCSEACSTGTPVFIYSPEGNAPIKHRRFHKSMFEKGFAKPFDEKSKNLILRNFFTSRFSGKHLATSKVIADKIKADLFK